MSKYINKPNWLMAWLYCLCAHVIFSFVFMLITNLDKIFELKLYGNMVTVFIFGLVFVMPFLLILHFSSFLLIKMMKFSKTKIVIIGFILGLLIGLDYSGFDYDLSEGLVNELKNIRPIFYISVVYGALLGFVFLKGLYRSRSG
ncbi:hypothetical protein [Marinicella pacifica]|nr:hypothetical protein [Marinicella pacifica]